MGLALLGAACWGWPAGGWLLGAGLAWGGQLGAACWGRPAGCGLLGAGLAWGGLLGAACLGRPAWGGLRVMLKNVERANHKATWCIKIFSTVRKLRNAIWDETHFVFFQIHCFR